MCFFRKHVTSAPAEFGGEIHNVSQQAQKLHVFADRARLAPSGYPAGLYSIV